MASMTVEELLIKIGVDASQASKIDEIVNKLGNAANKIGSNVSDISTSIKSGSKEAVNAVKETGEEAEKSTKKVGGFKLALLAVAAAGAFLATKLANALNRTIANTSKLTAQKSALFNISNDEIAQAKEYQGALAKTKLSLEALGTKIALNIAPAITKITNAFNGWLVGNKELISKGLSVVIKTITLAIQVVMNTVTAINKLISSTIGWKNALIILGVAWAIFNRALLLSPMGLIIAAIIGILLVIDDLMVYLQGGGSQFASFWAVCIEWIDKAKEAWENMGEGTMSILKSLLVFISVFAGAKGIGLMLTSVLGMTKKVVGAIKLVGVAFKALTTIIMTNPILVIVAAIAAAAYLIYNNWDWLSGWFKKLWASISATFDEWKEDTVAVFNDVYDSVSEFISDLIDFFSPIFSIITYPFQAAYKLVTDLFDLWGDDSKGFTEKLGESFSLVTDLITAPFKKAMTWIKDKFFGMINYVGNKVKGMFSFLGFGGGDSKINTNDLDKFIDEAPINKAANNAVTGATTAANDNRTYKSGDVHVTQHIATNNPEKAGELSGQAIGKELTKANYANKTGFAH